MIAVVLFAIGDQPVESAGRLILPTQCPVGQTLIQDHVGGLIAVIHGGSRFLIADGGQLHYHRQSVDFCDLSTGFTSVYKSGQQSVFKESVLVLHKRDWFLD